MQFLKLNSLKKEKFKKYLVLGDMLELGVKTKKYHEEISRVINSSDIDKVFVKGKLTIFTYKHLDKNKKREHFTKYGRYRSQFKRPNF